MWGRVQDGDGFNCLCAIEKGKLIRSTCLIHVFFIAKGERRGETLCQSVSDDGKHSWVHQQVGGGGGTMGPW